MFNYSPSTCTGKGDVGRKSLPPKQEKDLLYERLFPAFTPQYNYSVFFLHENTTNEDLDYLINATSNTQMFSLDTESDEKSNAPALIQISLMNIDLPVLPVIVVEVHFLPSMISTLFFKIKQIFVQIFRQDAHVYVWGSLVEELNPFLRCQLFSFPLSSLNYNVQWSFPHWYKQWLEQQRMENENAVNVVDDMVVINAPRNDPALLLPAQMFNELKLNSKQKWSLQDAVAYLFQQHLSKKWTLRKWSIGLDTHLNNHDRTINPDLRRQLINYVTYDCLSLAQIVVFMRDSMVQNPFIIDQPVPKVVCRSVKKPGKFSLPDKLHAFDDSSSDEEVYVASCVKKQESSMTIVHDKNEHRLIEPQSDSLSNQVQQETVKVVTAQIKKKRRRISRVARQRKNQKSSRRHRKNRYNHEVIRPVNMSMTEVKQILKQRGISKKNINIVGSTLFIGVKNRQQQEDYEEQLEQDLFL